MTKFIVPDKRKGQKATPFAGRGDPLILEAVRRVASKGMRDHKGRLISVSAILITGAAKLPEVREEIANVKREKRGERDQAGRAS